MISRELDELCNDIFKQLHIAIETSHRCDIVKSFQENGDGISINNFSSSREYSYEDFRVNLYIDIQYFHRNILRDARGGLSSLAYEILTYQTVMDWPIYLVVEDKNHPPYKIFITMKGE